MRLLQVTVLLISLHQAAPRHGQQCRFDERCTRVTECPTAQAALTEVGRLRSDLIFCGYDLASPCFRFKVCCSLRQVRRPSQARRGALQQGSTATRLELACRGARSLQIRWNGGSGNGLNAGSVERSGSAPWNESRLRAACEEGDHPGVQHPHLNLLPSHCGLARAPELLQQLKSDAVWSSQAGRRSKRVVEGKESKLMEQPWMARLLYVPKGSVERMNLTVLCGGTLITPRYVLTAAHCILNDKYDLVGVSLGERDLRRRDPGTDCRQVHDSVVCAPQPLEMVVDRVHVHRYYTRHTLANDIALIRLRNPALHDPTRMSVTPICLPVGASFCEPLLNQTLTVAGWGSPRPGVDSSPVLRVAELTAHQGDWRSCRRRFRAMNSGLAGTISEFTVCAAGSQRQDSCAGDSGGPLLTYSAGRAVQLGVVSFGPEVCGDPDLPGVYTRLRSYLHWILDTIQPD